MCIWLIEKEVKECLLNQVMGGSEDDVINTANTEV